MRTAVRLGVALSVLAMSGCAGGRCTLPTQACVDFTVTKRSLADGSIGIHLDDVHADSCANGVPLFCTIGAYDPSLSTGTERAFVFDPRTGALADPIGDTELVISSQQSFGFTCLELSDDQAAPLADCANADCGRPADEQKARDTAARASDCREAGFFIPVTVQ